MVVGALWFVIIAIKKVTWLKTVLTLELLEEIAVEEVVGAVSVGIDQNVVGVEDVAAEVIIDLKLKVVVAGANPIVGVMQKRNLMKMQDLGVKSKMNQCKLMNQMLHGVHLLLKENLHILDLIQLMISQLMKIEAGAIADILEKNLQEEDVVEVVLVAVVDVLIVGKKVIWQKIVHNQEKKVAEK